MLVSSIARFSALNTMSNAAFASMQTQNSMLNAVSTFGGEHDLSMINEIDKKLSMDLLTNSLLYRMAYLQEKLAAKHQDSETKRSLNVMA